MFASLLISPPELKNSLNTEKYAYQNQDTTPNYLKFALLLLHAVAGARFKFCLAKFEVEI